MNSAQQQLKVLCHASPTILPNHGRRLASQGVAVLFVTVLCTAPFLGQATAQTVSPRSANDRMLEPGPEAARLERRVGTWDVVMTLRPTPESTPVVVKGLIAERTMIGLYLQEIMRPAEGSGISDFRRLEYLTYNRVETRWQYVSMDTRVPVGLMPATGFGDDAASNITLYFQNFAIPGFGPELEGRLLRARHVTTSESDDRDITRQYWIGVGRPEWLAVQYEYTRKR
jgi:hypothetical protein